MFSMTRSLSEIDSATGMRFFRVMDEASDVRGLEGSEAGLGPGRGGCGRFNVQRVRVAEELMQLRSVGRS